MFSTIFGKIFASALRSNQLVRRRNCDVAKYVIDVVVKKYCGIAFFLFSHAFFEKIFCCCSDSNGNEYNRDSTGAQKVQLACAM
jgi:hypothetical protein